MSSHRSAGTSGSIGDGKKSWMPKTVLLSGSGMQILLHLGCLQALKIDDVQVWVGTSTASIISLFLTCGYTVKEIIDLIIPRIQKRDLTDLGTLTQVLVGDGLISLVDIRQWLEQTILTRCGSVPTLKGLYLQTGKTFAASTLAWVGRSAGGVQVLTWQTDPHISCVDACIRALNVPYICNGTVAYVDALLSLPSPAEYFDDDETPVMNIMIQNSSPGTRQTSEQTGDTLVSLIQHVNQSGQNDSFKGLGPAIQTLNALVLSRQFDCIDRTSNAVRHLLLPCYASDPVAYTADPGRLLADGFTAGWGYQHHGYVEPRIKVPTAFTYTKDE